MEWVSLGLAPVPDRVSLLLLHVTKKDQGDAMHFVQVVTAFFFFFLMDASWRNWLMMVDAGAS